MEFDKKDIKLVKKEHYVEPDKDVEICQSYDTIPILKFTFKSVEPAEPSNRLIFIGSQSENIMFILQKLEKRIPINDNEEIILSSAIPKYQKKFGDLTDNRYNNYFVDKYIEDNFTVDQIRILLCRYSIDRFNIKSDNDKNIYSPNNLLIYKYSKTINFKQLVDIINYIFLGETVITNTQLFDRLYKITLLSKQHIITKIHELLPHKYKSHEYKNITALEYDNYHYLDVFNNEEIITLIQNTPFIISNSYNIDHNGEIYKYYGHQNIDELIRKFTREKNNTKLENELLTELTSEKLEIDTNATILTTMIHSLERSIDNEYYVLLKNDASKIFPEKFIKHLYPFQPNLSRSNKHNITSDDLEHIGSLLEICSQQYNKNEYNPEICNITECKVSNIVFDIYSNRINTEYVLENIFNSFNTSYYLPVIKLYKNGEDEHIKIFKSFLQKHNYNELTHLVSNNSKSKLSYLYETGAKSYIQFKWRISNNIILVIDFDEVGYIRVFFNDDNYMNISTELLPYLELVRTTIKEIKRIINAKNITLPNINTLFSTSGHTSGGSSSGSIYYNNLIGIDMKNKILLNQKTHISKLDSTTLTQLIKEKLPYYQQFIPDIRGSSVKLIYKQVDNFYSMENIIQFMKIRIARTGGINKMTKNDKDKLFSYMRNKFMTDYEILNKIFDNIDKYPITTADCLLYGVDITIKFYNDGIIELIYDNVSNIHSVKKIQFYIKSILSSIEYDLSKNNQVSSKTSIMNKNAKKDKNISTLGQNNKFDNIELNNDQLLSDLDINFDRDLGNGGFDIDFDDIKIGNIDIGDFDLINGNSNINNQSSINPVYNIDDLARLIELNENIDNDNNKGISKKGKTPKVPYLTGDDDEFRNFNVRNIMGTDHKVRFSTYMSKMREHYDSELYKPITHGDKTYNYGDVDCDNTQRRQPFIVRKEDLDTFEPGSITGYLKFRGNYYICPRIWDYKENKPISVEAFIKAGLKSPYNKGLPVIKDSKGKEAYLDDEHTVIIRKPNTAPYWKANDPEKSNWPEMLKGTEADAYPSLMVLSNHPGQICAPCCSKSPPEDFDPNIKEIQRFCKPYKWKQCKYVDCDEDIKSGNIMGATALPGVGEDIPTTNQNKDDTGNVSAFDTQCYENAIDSYITGETTSLDHCRFGLLPKNLDILLNNHQDIFMDKSGKKVAEYGHLFLRRGVNSHEKKYNILEAISVILNISMSNLINKITNKLTPDIFISLNNGELVDVFSPSNVLPNTTDDLNRFNTFIKKYQLMLTSVIDIDFDIITKIARKNLGFMKPNIEVKENDMDLTNPDAPLYEVINVKKVMILYKIYRSFYNFIMYLINRDEYKDPKHFIDLICRPLPWLFTQGVNLLIFDKTGTNLMCNPFNNIKRSKYIILIQDDPLNFTPVFLYSVTTKTTKISGELDLKQVNIPQDNMNIFVKKAQNVKLLEQTGHRDDSLVNLAAIHNNICKSKYVIEGNQLLIDLNNIEIYPVEQIPYTTTQIEFIKFDYGILLPVYPRPISFTKSKFKFMDFNHDIISLDSYITIELNIKDIIYLKKLEKKGGNPDGVDVIIDENENLDMTELSSISNILSQHTKLIKLNKEHSNNKQPNKSSVHIGDTTIFEGSIEDPHSHEKFRGFCGIINNYGYRIKKIFYLSNENNKIDNTKNYDLIVAIQFRNGLVVPVNEEILTNERKNDICKILNIREQYLFEETHFNFKMNLAEENKYDIIDMKNVILYDYMYNYFKYEFSRILQDERQYKKKIIQLLRKYRERNYSTDIIIGNLAEYITNIMSIIAGKYNEQTDKKQSFNENIRGNKLNISGIKIQTCHQTKKVNKCNENPFCKYDKSINKCIMKIDNNYLKYFAYLLGNDLINNKIETETIIRGSFIPQYSIDNLLFRNSDEILLTARELSSIITNNIYSKYKKNIKLPTEIDFNTNKNTTDFTNVREHIFSNADLKLIEKHHIDEIKAAINKAIKQLVDGSIDNILPKDSIITTPFDKYGNYNPSMTVGECKLPFYGKQRRPIYQCVNNPRGFICPTKLDGRRVPNKNHWGYCPEKPEETNKRLNVIGIHTVGDEANPTNPIDKSTNKQEYFKGDCIFPYISMYNTTTNEDVEYTEEMASGDKKIPENTRYKLKFDCMNNKEKGGFSWCPVKMGYDNNKYGLYVAANDKNSILEGRWRSAKLIDPSTKMPNKGYMSTKKRGYCSPPMSALALKEGICNDDGKPQITIENYNTQNCGSDVTPSKGGYTRPQLCKFAIDHLKIPHTLVRKGDTILPKDDLCNLVNKKYREIRVKRDITDNDRSESYKKPLEYCVEGPEKGGYLKSELQEMAVNYFGIKDDDAKQMSKSELCSHIIPIIRRIREGVSEKFNKNKYIYPGKIEQCKEPPQFQGINVKRLKEIANTNFGINTDGMSKDDICDKIQFILDKIAKGENIDDTEDKNDEKKQITGYDDIAAIDPNILSIQDELLEKKKKITKLKASDVKDI